MTTLSRQRFLCRDSILCISSNSYVATPIIMSQHSFSASSASWCRDQSFHVTTASLFRLCCNIILYYLHFCRDRGLLPLSLTSCCNFVLDVVTWTFVFGMFCMLRFQYVMSQQHFSVCSMFSCRELVFLVAT